MNILVINCGSSSLKYKLIRFPGEEVLAGGEAQRVGTSTSEPSVIFHRVKSEEVKYELALKDHDEAFYQVMQILKKDSDLIPDAVGHRIVHGGDIFAKTTILDSDSLSRLEELNVLAPLHNPIAVKLIRTCMKDYSHLLQIGVFDTAYHASIPDYARTYPIPGALAEQLGVRKYGFHGTSHQYVIQEAAAFLKKDITSFNAVSCHLGSGGASLCAVVNGQSVDNSMGFSPLQGLVMSTRSGDFDPGTTMQLLFNSINNGQRVDDILNRKSGVLGLSGISSDIRDIIMQDSADQTNTSIGNTIKIYINRIKKYLGAYLAVVGHADALIFTDTIGETISPVREAVCENMEFFGLEIDTEKSRSLCTLPADISTQSSNIRILVILTNEELAIARESYYCIQNYTMKGMVQG